MVRNSPIPAETHFIAPAQTERVVDYPRLLWIAPPENAPKRIPRVNIHTAPTMADALSALEQIPFDAVLATFPDEFWTPEEFLEEARRVDREVSVLLRSVDASLPDVCRWVQLGADYVFADEPDSEGLAGLMDSLHQRYLTRLAEHRTEPEEPWRKLLVGRSPAIERVCSMIRLVAQRRSTVLISGETGTGKELIARAIHRAGNRGHLPMIAVNCGAIPENLLEAELFGHVKGAFTGAHQNRIGYFEQANHSTIFLDEIADLPLDLQGKLLRVLQERELQRVGSAETVRLDVRVVAASNVDLAERVQEGKFREDLYYRLNVVPIRTPALRDRVSDIPVLVDLFIGRCCSAEGIARKRVAPATMDRLTAYPWPGNVRQLENAVEMAVTISGDREILYPSDFPLPHAPARLRTGPMANAVRLPEGGLDFEQAVNDFERQILEQALERSAGNKNRAAQMLRLKRTTLAAKWKTLGAAACSPS